MSNHSGVNFVKKNITNPIAIIIITLISIALVTFIINFGKMGFTAILGLVIGVPLIIASIANIKLGFSVIFIISSFMFYIKRAFDLPLKMGVIADFFYYPIIIGILLQRPKINLKELFQNKIYLFIFIWYCLLLLEAINPEASLSAWILGMRINLRMILVVISAAFVFSEYKYVKSFIYLFFFVAIVAALYGFYQEYVGLPPYDYKWLMEEETRAKLNFFGERKWSILSNSTDFGLFMATSSLFFIIIALGPYRSRIRYLAGMGGLIMMVAMSFSGARTAYAIFLAGIVFYLLNNIHRRHSIIISGLSVLLFLAIMYGPFHGNSQIRRIRSTFRPNQDASYLMRENKQERIRPYIYSHPIGGGLYTTGAEGQAMARGHRLAGFQTDSYYLESAMETGWVGFALYLTLLASVVITGILNYHKAVNPVYKNLLMAFTCFFFSLSIAGYTQETMTQIPYGIIFYSCILLVNRLNDFDQAA